MSKKSKQNPRRQPNPAKAKQVGQLSESVKPRVTGMNPIQVGRAMRMVDHLYEGGDPNVFTYEWKQAQIAHIMECSKAWGQQ